MCQPCKAALKRARYLSVQDLPPESTIGAGRPKRRGRRAASEAPRAPVRSATVATRPRQRFGTRRMQIVGGAGLAVLAVAVFFAQPGTMPVVPSPPPTLANPPAAAVPAGDAVDSEGADPGAAGAMPPAPVPAFARPKTTAPVAESRPAVSPPPTVGNVPAPARPVRATAKDVSLDSFGPEASKAPAPRPPPPAPVVVRAPPPPDRWAQMRTALAKCDREGGFSGFICDQRVRLEGCEGYWGRVPDCPGPPENPGGQ